MVEFEYREPGHPLSDFLITVEELMQLKFEIAKRKRDPAIKILRFIKNNPEECYFSKIAEHVRLDEVSKPTVSNILDMFVDCGAIDFNWKDIEGFMTMCYTMSDDMEWVLRL